MDDVLAEFASPRFWIPAVFLGLVLNVFGAYLVRTLDHGRSRLARLWANRSRKAREAFDRDVAALCGNPRKQLLALAEENRERLRFLSGIIFGLFFFALALTSLAAAVALRSAPLQNILIVLSVVSFDGGLLVCISALRALSRGVRQGDLVYAAQAQDDGDSHL